MLSTADILSVAKVYGYVAIWISLSASVILYNKYILTVYGFPYPIALTLMHMGFCSTIAAVLIKTGVVESCANMDMEKFIRGIIPIGFLFSGTLWLGNAAYLFLSVSFVQMLKALMPVLVFTVGVGFGTELFKTPTFLNMIVIGIGVCIASYGEINFVVVGVILQLMSMCTEAVRLTLVQILLQSRGLKLNPITSLYYISPCCFIFLSIPFAVYEAHKIINDPFVTFDIGTMLLNCIVAFALNLSVFLLIGKTSALTMNIAGVVKDWILIGLSVLLFESPVTQINLIGYGISFIAVGYYNYAKLKEKAAQAAKAVQEEISQPDSKLDIKGPASDQSAKLASDTASSPSKISITQQNQV